ncbi:hypothetical protein [Ruminococcus sp. HUN007]|uniref:hypothetical protein n=1 Tax=Ruminococcus sp. HUN007 TaxID=1514668 RepID=UPI0005D199F4|nr:hypothetical protein [Ruminococcus sp. HUN007]
MMSRKNIISVFLISLAGVAVWFVGFLVIMILKFENSPQVNKVWLIITFGATMVFSVVKNMKNDGGKDEKKDK